MARWLYSSSGHRYNSSQVLDQMVHLEIVPSFLSTSQTPGPAACAGAGLPWQPGSDHWRPGAGAAVMEGQTAAQANTCLPRAMGLPVCGSVGFCSLIKTQQAPGLFNMQKWELTLSLRQVVCNLLVEVKIFHQRCHQKLLSYANFCGNMKTDVE